MTPGPFGPELLRLSWPDPAEEIRRGQLQILNIGIAQTVSGGIGTSCLRSTSSKEPHLPGRKVD
jgi:hypothetical protein